MKRSIRRRIEPAAKQFVAGSLVDRRVGAGYGITGASLRFARHRAAAWQFAPGYQLCDAVAAARANVSSENRHFSRRDGDNAPTQPEAREPNPPSSR